MPQREKKEKRTLPDIWEDKPGCSPCSGSLVPPALHYCTCRKSMLSNCNCITTFPQSIGVHQEHEALTSGSWSPAWSVPRLELPLMMTLNKKYSFRGGSVGCSLHGSRAPASFGHSLETILHMPATTTELHPSTDFAGANSALPCKSKSENGERIYEASGPA